MKKITVRVLPRSSKNEVAGPMADGALKIKLTTAPVDGKANKELIKLLADYFRVAKSKIKIAAGATGRNKIIEIEE